MARKFFAHVRNLIVVFLFVAAFTLVASPAVSAQEAGSVPDYDRPWQHFAQSGLTRSRLQTSTATVSSTWLSQTRSRARAILKARSVSCSGRVMERFTRR
jgi:hypothetical protein